MATDQDTRPANRPHVPLGGDYWQGDPGVPLWGLADTHAHLMAHLAFGGKAFWGQPYDLTHPGEAGMAQALSSCESIHGGLGNINPEFGHLAAAAWSDFNVWPRFTTMVHQQVYVAWLRRAYEGGLRLVSCLAVNNELLARKTNPDPHADFRDSTAIATQVAAMRDMQAWIAAHDGGWLEIADTPEDAARIIGAGKLAIVLGVEVDALGDWHSPDDLARLAGGDPTRVRQVIAGELDKLYRLGIRQITPIHLADNAFGGTAIYLRFLELSNVALTGEAWDVENAFARGIRYRLDQDGVDLVNEIERRIAGLGLPQPRLAMNRRTLIDTLPGLQEFADRTSDGADVAGGHANKRGLHAYGQILLEEMMQRGMMIDVDHMSGKATDRALDLAESQRYPVISSHDAFIDLAYSADVPFAPNRDRDYQTGDVHKVAHEGMKTAEQVERIARLGGLVAPILNQGDVAGLARAMPALAGKVPQPCAGSATSWAQAYLYAAAKMGGRGVAIGSDINGAAGLPGPRFGTFASYGARTDTFRNAQRAGEIARQKNGVKYDRPPREYRWFRFEDSGPGGYDQTGRQVWQAIAEFKAGFDPRKMPHLAADFPPPGIAAVLAALGHVHDQGTVDDFAKGLWAAGEHPTDWEISSWSPQQQAAYLARGGADNVGLLHDPWTHALFDCVKEVWAKWEDMEQGDNPPLARCVAGPRRDWDINLDGMAHYGLLPDFLQDLRNVGLTPQDLAPLFRSANDYVEVWRTCVSRSQELSGSAPATPEPVPAVRRARRSARPPAVAEPTPAAGGPRAADQPPAGAKPAVGTGGARPAAKPPARPRRRGK